MDIKNNQENESKLAVPLERSQNRQRRWLSRIRRFFYGILLLLLLVAGFLAFLLFTETGMQTVAYGVNQTLSRWVTIRGAEGTLGRQLRIADLTIQINAHNSVKISALEVKWSFRQLFSRKIMIDRMTAGAVTVDVKRSSAPEQKKEKQWIPFSLRQIKLPVEITAQLIQARNLNILLPDFSMEFPIVTLDEVVFSNQTWGIDHIAFEGLLAFKELVLPLKSSATLQINPSRDAIDFSLLNTSTGMKINSYVMDHALNFKISGTLERLLLEQYLTINWPDMIAKPVTLSVKSHIDDQNAISLESELFNQDNQMSLSGRWLRTKPLDFEGMLNINATDLSKTHPEFTGMIKGDIQVSGSIAKPFLEGALEGTMIKLLGFSLAKIKLAAHHDENALSTLILELQTLVLKNLMVSSVNLKVTGEKLEVFNGQLNISEIMQNGKVLIEKARLESAGTLKEHSVTLAINSALGTVDLEGKAQLDLDQTDPAWTLHIDKFDIFGDVIGTFRLDQPGVLFVSQKDISLSRLCINNLPMTFCAEGNKNKERAVGSIVLRQLKPALLNHYLPEDVKIDTTLDLVLSGRFVNPDDFIGVADLSLRKGAVNYQMQGRSIEMPLTKTHMRLLAKPEQIKAELSVDWGTYLQANGASVLTEPFGTRNIEGHLNIYTPTLNWILPLIPDVQRLNGDLAANVTLSGTLDKPDLGVQMQWAKGEIYVAEYNTRIYDINFGVNLEKGTPVLKAVGGLKAGNGHLGFAGTINIRDLSSTMDIVGVDLLLADSEQLKVLVNPVLKFVSEKNRHALTGVILVSELDYQHEPASDNRGRVKTASSDVHIISSQRPVQEKRERKRDRLTIDLDVMLSDQISVSAMGFIGKLTGNIKLLKKQNKSLTAVGTIDFEKGVYEILGQELTLDKGRIAYSGGSITNPSIEFQASRQFDNKRTGTKVDVGVRVTGTPKRLKLKLYSRPGMPDNSIIAYLVLGSDPETLNAAETLKIVRMARKIMTGDIINTKGEPPDGIAEQLGVSEIGLIQDLSGNSAFGIGKNINDNLYFGFGVGIFEEGAFATLRYKFLKWFNIDSQIGTEHSSFDLRYAREL